MLHCFFLFLGYFQTQVINHITNKRGSMEPNTLKKILFLRRNKQVIDIHPPDGKNKLVMNLSLQNKH